MTLLTSITEQAIAMREIISSIPPDGLLSVIPRVPVHAGSNMYTIDGPGTSIQVALPYGRCIYSTDAQIGRDTVRPGGVDLIQAVNAATMSAMETAGIFTLREIPRQLWRGNPVTHGEMTGLDNIVTTGIRDCETGTLAPCLDSHVKDFQYANAGGVGRNIAEYLSMMEWYLQFNARRNDLSPVRWIVAMRPELWYELSTLWKERYVVSESVRNRDVKNVVSPGVCSKRWMRDELKILVNGSLYDVVLDTNILECSADDNDRLGKGQLASSIYFLPMTVTDNVTETDDVPVLEMQYLDYRQREVVVQGDCFWTDDGMYAWATEQQRWDFQLSVMTQQRVVLKTPQLAGVVKNVMYQPLAVMRQ